LLLILKLNIKISLNTAAVTVAWVKVDIALETACSLAYASSTTADYLAAKLVCNVNRLSFA
jgi:hypothetical protein